MEPILAKLSILTIKSYIGGGSLLGTMNISALKLATLKMENSGKVQSSLPIFVVLKVPINPLQLC